MRGTLSGIVLGLLALRGSAGTIDTIAGTGRAGYAGDGGPARQARLHQPFHCDLDGKGRLYVADVFNHCIRRIDPKTGTITTVAGTGTKGYGGDGGPATKATLNEPYAVAVTPAGDLYIVDRLNAVIRRVDGNTGRMTTVAGTGRRGYSGDGGPGTEARLNEPNDCCLDGKGGLLIADVSDWRIRRLDLGTGRITTFAGTGRILTNAATGRVDRARIGDGGPATKAVLVGSRAVCVDGRGNTYVCEREGNAIRKVDARGTITTVAGTGRQGKADGPGSRATFNGPKGLRCDAQGNVFIADTENHAIRRLDARTREVTTVAGGHQGKEGDGGDARKAGLDRPHGCLPDKDGTLYIADSSNNRVRRVLNLR